MPRIRLNPIGGYQCLHILFMMALLLGAVVQPAYSQESDLEKARILNEQVVELYQQGRYAEAIPIAKKVLAIRKKLLGPDHSDVAISLNNLALLYMNLGDYAKAEPLYKRSLAIKEKALGPEHPEVSISLSNLAGLYSLLGDLSKAEPLYKRALAINEKALGPEHPSVAISLNNLALLYKNLGDYAKAEPLYKKALAIGEKSLGQDHPKVATTIDNLAGLYRNLGDYAKAEPLYKRSLSIKEKALGPDHPDVATSLNNLALLYMNLGDYAKAEPLYKRSLSIKEKALGQEHPKVATTIDNLAGLYRNLGDYAKAEPLYKRALAINEKALGPDHPSVAISLNNLALLYKNLGDYAKAELLYKKALVLYEKTLGLEHPEIANFLNNLGLLYYSIGAYAKAESFFKRALMIKEKALGPEHPDVAGIMNNLAGLYHFLGDYAKSIAFYNSALEINEKTFGPKHRAVALSLNNIAVLYTDLGDYANAESLLMRALRICEETLGTVHPQVAASLNNLAGVYQSQGDYAKAAPLHKKALAINEKLFGYDHPDVANSLNNLGLIHHHLGNYTQAESCFKRALVIKERALGSKHPSVSLSLNNLASLYAVMGDFRKAHDLKKRIQHLDDELIDQVMGFTSKDQKIGFLLKRNHHLHSFISLVIQHLYESPLARIDSLNSWIKRKGVILEAQRRFQEALVYSDDPKAVKIFQELSRVRAKLSRVVFSGPGKAGPDAYKKRIADLEAQKEKLEAKLSRLSSAFALKKKVAKADCEKVAEALPEKTALLEFARVGMFNFKAKGKENKWLPAHYIAFVLHAGKGDRVGMIDLGDAEEIDKAVAKLKKQISVMDEKSIKSSRKIYELVFKPIRKDLGDVKEIFISPDGNLNLIPFEVLQGPDGRYLIEDYTFNYLSAGRDVLGFGQIKGKGEKALLMGDPAFDIGEEEKGSTLRKLALSESKEEDIARRSTDMRGFGFKRLPGTREEVKAIQGLLGENKAELYIGKEALEEVLMQRKTPSILHLATHGFFLSDLELSDIRDDTFSRGMQQMIMFPRAKGKRIKIENPLLRSGIALAGANNALKSGDTEKSDGIVTAEKILGLRLRGTDMVVLSACNTGVGEVKTGEGVFGLRRAFTQAGAKSMVMSMWSVPDRETKELMIEFYRNILSGKMNRSQALRQAALKEMRIVEERHGHACPICWGGFVFIGEP